MLEMGAIAGAEILEIEWVERELREGVAVEENADDGVGLREWQRPQEDAFDNAEDGAGGSDAEGERQQDDDREAGRGAQRCEVNTSGRQRGFPK